MYFMKKRILIVDDDPLIHQLLRHLFEFEDYSVTTANNGVEGIDKTRTFGPHLIVMDYMMPRLDGLSACKAITSDPLTQHIPIIILSAYASVEMPERAVTAGARLFLDKSRNIPEGLLEAVAEVLSKENTVYSSKKAGHFF